MFLQHWIKPRWKQKAVGKYSRHSMFPCDPFHSLTTLVPLAAPHCNLPSSCTMRHYWTQQGLENFSFCLSCHSLVIWPLANHLTGLTFGFLMGKIKVCTRCSLKSLQARKCHEFMNTINSRLLLFWHRPGLASWMENSFENKLALHTMKMFWK